MTKSRILVVDDHHALPFLIRERLMNKEYEVEIANGFDEAYAAFLSFRPDLVITDIEMDGEDSGFRLISNIRNFAPNIKVIYITGDLNRYRTALEKERKRYHASFLEKPFAGDVLMMSVYAQEQGREEQAA